MRCPLYVFSYSGLLLCQNEELALNGQSVAWIDSTFSMKHIMTIDLFAEISNGSLLSMDIEAETFTREHPFEQPS
jgi:hypothetical protein